MRTDMGLGLLDAARSSKSWRARAGRLDELYRAGHAWITAALNALNDFSRSVFALGVIGEADWPKHRVGAGWTAILPTLYR